MCKIEGSVRFLIGQHDTWSRGLDDGLVDELEHTMRSKIRDEFGAISDLDWTLTGADLDGAPTELHAREHTAFLDHQLEIINRDRPKGERIWYDATDDDEGIRCCFIHETRWYPCGMYPLYKGAVKDRTPLAISIEHEELEEPLEIPLWIQVTWTSHLTPPDEDEDTREKIYEIAARTSGEPLKKALALLEGTSA